MKIGGIITLFYYLSSYPTSVSGIIVLLNTKHWIKIFRTIFSTNSSLRPFCGKIICDKNVSFHIWTNNSIQDLYRE